MKDLLALGSSACVVLDDFTPSRLSSYSQALGLDSGPVFVQQTTTALMKTCVCKAGSEPGSFNNMVELYTCPTTGGLGEPLELQRALNLTRTVVLKHLADFRQVVSNQGKLQASDSFLALEQAIMSVSPRVVGPWCSKTGAALASEQCAALQQAYSDACADTSAPGCDRPLLPVPDCAAGDFGGLREALTGLVKLQSQRLQASLDNSTRTAFVDLWVELDREVFSNVAKLGDNLDCGFARQALEGIVEGACFELMIGLCKVHDALLALGILCLATSLINYVLWLRLTQFRALAVEYQAKVISAVSGGQLPDLSRESRLFAQKGSTTSWPNFEVQDDLVPEERRPPVTCFGNCGKLAL